MFTARPAAATDLALVRAITDSAYAAYIPLFGGLPIPMQEDYVPRIASNQVWLVSRNDEDLGLAVLIPEDDHLMIFSLAVLPKGQGAGLGQWMLQFAEAQARAAGLDEIRLYTNALMTRNIGIYLKAGFHETGRRANPNRPGWVFVDMAKAV